MPIQATAATQEAHSRARAGDWEPPRPMERGHGREEDGPNLVCHPCSCLATTALQAIPATTAHGSQDYIPPFQALRKDLAWWKRLAPPKVLNMFVNGVEPNFKAPPLKLVPTKRSSQEVSQALKVMEEYISVGAAKEVSRDGTKYLIPRFVICKKRRVRERKGTSHLRLPCDKLLFATAPLQVGSMEGHFPHFKKRHVGLQDRPQKCVFSFATLVSPKTLCKDGHRWKGVSNGGGMFWFEYPSLPLDASDARFSEKNGANKAYWCLFTSTIF